MTARTCYLFGRFRLSADGTMLLRDGAPVPLAPKALRTLLTLVEHAGEVVTKEQLLETVWPDSFVEDTGLTRNISVVRQALGIDGSFDGLRLDHAPFALRAPENAPEISVGKRIGISKAVDQPWRFGLKGSPFLSRRF